MSIKLNARTLAFIGSALMVIGAFLPWATITAPLVGTMSVTGIRGDGMFTAGIGALLLLGAVFTKGKPGKMYSVGIGGLAVLAVLLAGYSALNVINTPTESAAVSTAIGSGLFATIIGAIVAAVGGFQKLPAEASVAPPVPETPIS